MRGLWTCSLLLSLLIMCSGVSRAGQSGAGDTVNKTPKKEQPKTSKPTPVTKAALPKKDRPTSRGASRPMPPTMGDLIVSTMPDSVVLLNGQGRGNTDNSGQLHLSGLRPGSYTITVRKAGYREDQRMVSLSAGQREVATFQLSAIPGTLSVNVNVAGAEIGICNIGSYTDKVTSLSLPPGTCRISVSKPGYQTSTHDVEIKAGAVLNVPVTLEPVPVDELLQRAMTLLQIKNYNQAQAICLSILSFKPDHPRANLIMGLSYYYSDNYSESAPYLANAITLGEQAVLPIRHHHRFILSDDLCTGRITIGGGILAFNSANRAGHDFSVPAKDIYELKPEPHKGGRIHVKVGVQKGEKVDKKSYNFHVVHAGTRRYDPNNASSIMVVYCDNCEQETQLIYQLLLQLQGTAGKDNGSPGRPTLKRRN